MTLTPQQLYQLLSNHFGIQQWWPIDKTYHKDNNSDPRFEIMVGAILTQNTAWTNVEKALDNLKKNKVVSVDKILHLSNDELKTLIQPSGFFNQKAERLKTLCHFIFNSYDNNLDKMFHTPISTLQTQLLSLHGIGPETADSMLLYAGKKPIFVVDAYTTRLTQRIPFSVDNFEYNTIQNFFQTHLQKTYNQNDIVWIYQQYHALLVECAKQYCKKKPLCTICPVEKRCNKNLL